MRGNDGEDDCAWINDALTGATLWRPADATHLTWLRGGTEVGLIGKTFTPDPDKSAIFANKLQSEMGYWFERWSWPERRQISRAPITMRTGWPTDLLPTPDPNLVFFEWYDQGEAGYEGIALSDTGGDTQLPAESYELGYPDMEDVQSPLFSQDARYMVRCHGRRIKSHVPADWAQSFVAAYLTVIDRRQGCVYDIPVLKAIPPKWMPTQENAPKYRDEDAPSSVRGAGLWAQIARFLDQDHVAVHFVDDTSAVVALADTSLTTIPPLPPQPEYEHVMPDRNDHATEAVIDAYYQHDREPSKHLRHPHELIAIKASGESNIIPSKRREWISDADGHALWEPEDALMMVWLFDGTQVGILRGEHFSYHATAPQALAFERWSWPERTLISRLPLSDMTGEPHKMLISPQGYTVSIIMENDAGRLCRIIIDPDGGNDRVVTSVPLEYEITIVGETSDDARLIALKPEGCGWPTHAAMFRHARRYIAGTLSVFDNHAEIIHEIPLLADFPANWVPPDLAARRSPLLPWFYQTSIPLVEEARLIDDITVYIRFATKEERTIDISSL